MLARILAILTAISFALTLWRWILGLRFPVHRRGIVHTCLPGITFLKPLKGCDAETRDCLKSWFLQKYPGPVQFLFGVASADDPVRAIVRELLEEFPNVDARLIVCGDDLGANAKVSTLRQLEPHCRHELIMVSDADVRVSLDFAANISPLLEDPAVGLVNCFYALATPSTAGDAMGGSRDQCGLLDASPPIAQPSSRGFCPRRCDDSSGRAAQGDWRFCFAQ